MPAETNDIVAIRREIWTLLRKQLEALESASVLTDGELMQCYERQARVQELREKLEASCEPGTNAHPILSEMRPAIDKRVNQQTMMPA
jgi:hypothetical protein